MNSFMAGDYESARSEIRAMRAAVDDAAESLGKKVVLKVILETGLLVTPERIADASLLAMEEGADFIKTSTGKVSVKHHHIGVFGAQLDQSLAVAFSCCDLVCHYSSPPSSAMACSACSLFGALPCQPA